MAQKKSPTIFVIPGAFHTPVHFKKVTDLLEPQGYRVVGYTHPVPGQYKGDSSFEGLVADIRTAIKAEIDAGDDVMVVVHSASGLTGPTAIEGLVKEPGSGKPGVVALFAISAIMGNPGQNLSDVLQGGASSWINVDDEISTAGEFDTPAGDVAVTGPTRISTVTAIYHDVSPAEQREAYDALVPIYASGFLGQPKKRDDWRKVQTTYVVCEQDKAMFAIIQGGVIIKLKQPNIRVRYVDSSHSPFISKPKEIADLIVEAINELPA